MIRCVSHMSLKEQIQLCVAFLQAYCNFVMKNHAVVQFNIV